jgi:hypothetical protein
LIPVFLCLISAEARVFELKEWLEEIEGIIPVYVDEEIIIEDASEIKICFLTDAHKYQGLSVQELFDRALEQLPLGPRTVLIAAIFNIKSSSWMFLYREELGCRRRVRKERVGDEKNNDN